MYIREKIFRLRRLSGKHVNIREYNEKFKYPKIFACGALVYKYVYIRESMKYEYKRENVSSDASLTCVYK